MYNLMFFQPPRSTRLSAVVAPARLSRVAAPEVFIWEPDARNVYLQTLFTDFDYRSDQNVKKIAQIVS